MELFGLYIWLLGILTGMWKPRVYFHVWKLSMNKLTVSRCLFIHLWISQHWCSSAASLSGALSEAMQITVCLSRSKKCPVCPDVWWVRLLWKAAYAPRITIKQIPVSHLVVLVEVRADSSFLWMERRKKQDDSWVSGSSVKVAICLFLLKWLLPTFSKMPRTFSQPHLKRYLIQS